MAYNKRNHLTKILEIQEITKEKQRLGLTNTKIYQLHIKKHYHISKSTFDSYLGIPAARDLKVLEAAEEAKKAQIKLFDDGDN